ncbi:L-type lectin-domain containing receptor kinase VIII.1 [Platanthera guangdongensis]|uniref:non-specific serine/threonine protein kinase n=1 Tax=Platanthera guangdongensis TaxID=2320717 RepID=A0ABR2M9F4_9ASPA
MPPEKSSRRRFQRYCITLLELFLTILTWSDGTATLKFDLASLKQGGLKLLGDAHLKNGSIRLSQDLPVPNSSSGRALFSEPVRLRNSGTGAVLPFSTFFSFHVINLNPSSIGGGLTFLLTSDDHALGDPGGFLGLISSSAVNPPVIAVEFDTLMDVEFEDINGNHIGVDLDTMVSAQIADLDSAGIDLKSGNLINAWIEYDRRGVLQVFVSYSTVRPESPVLDFLLDLTQLVEEFMFVGFSGSTQGSTEIHSIESWSFSSTALSSPASSALTPLFPPPPSPAAFRTNSSLPPPAILAPSISISVAKGPSNKHPSSSSCHSNSLCRQGPAAVVGVAGAGACFIAACAALGIWAFTRRTRSVKKWDSLAAATDIVKSPREFTYRELVTATHGFNSSRIIGHGAFGTVYKGIIPETGAMVAVKRCINARGDNAAAQGRAEFLSELLIIASLRHRNLVRLQGWCQEKGEILLVYDYMRHGSLDKALFDHSSTTLPLQWRHRRKILAGVASAVAYLHHECERLVIHRDVKSSNVMLDENFHPRLGDFGLARQVDHDRSPDATAAAGTMGYLAPEYLLTGRASDKTDVFSFGALVLEVVSGRRPIDEKRKVSLVEWVWGLHREGRLLEAVDSRLDGEVDDREMRTVLLVGLGCSSPDPAVRPGMRTVVQMLCGEAEPPNVPAANPHLSLSSNHQLLINLQDSVSDYNAIGLNLDSSSSSSSSRTSILRDGSGGGTTGASAAGG